MRSSDFPERKREREKGRKDQGKEKSRGGLLSLFVVNHFPILYFQFRERERKGEGRGEGNRGVSSKRKRERKVSRWVGGSNATNI